VVTLAARTPVPALAAIGATLGSLIVIVPAALMGETAWRSLPLKSLRMAIGGMFIVSGIILALGALRLV
jgi:putative Ca2+/H+ antiporter (TMEM165/GDT1 family)